MHKININKTKILILLSPLDWGLGHTTRCIPLIRELLRMDCEVLFAGNETQTKVIQSEFENLPVFPLEGYNLRYGKNRRMTILKIIFQIPRILIKINAEKRWLAAFLRQYPVDGVISDNRYGFFAENIPSVLVTHQLAIQSGINKATDRGLRLLNYALVQQFASCWVPDQDDFPNLAGSLSHPPAMPRVPVTYIGLLSRMTRQTDMPVEREILIVLSGPEPQRTLLENILMHAFEAFPGKALLVRGLPMATEQLPSTTNLHVLNYAASDRLNELICTSDLIVCRPGYSSMMDLLSIGKKCVVIPTPGQGEQEYLAKHLHQQQWAYAVSQHDFSLGAVLKAVQAFDFKVPDIGSETYKPVLQEWIDSLRAKQR